MKPSRSLIFLAGIATALAGTGLAQVFPSVSFPDVLSESFYAPSVDRFVRRGIVRGYEDGRFGPEDYVTRGQAMVMFDRFDQRIIQPLRDQIEQMRQELGLGQCGDGEVQAGEQCDDGNTFDEDGCSAECFREVGVGCPGGWRIGDTFPAADGCNTCSCTLNGILCTLIECSAGEPEEPKEMECYSNDNCGEGEACSVIYGECRRIPCPPDAICPQVCAGTCVPERDKSEETTCGNGVCEPNELPYYTVAKHLIYCPEDCAPQRHPVCGNGICERGERSGSLFTETCPEDCESYASVCGERKDEFWELVDIFGNCQHNRDCELFEYSCPFVTCGVAVNGEGLSRLERKARDIISICSREGEEEVCAACEAQHAECENEKCVLKEGW